MLQKENRGNFELMLMFKFTTGLQKCEIKNIG